MPVLQQGTEDDLAVATAWYSADVNGEVQRTAAQVEWIPGEARRRRVRPRRKLGRKLGRVQPPARHCIAAPVCDRERDAASQVAPHEASKVGSNERILGHEARCAKRGAAREWEGLVEDGAWRGHSTYRNKSLARAGGRTEGMQNLLDDGQNPAEWRRTSTLLRTHFIASTCQR